MVDVPLAPGGIGPDRLAAGADAQRAGRVAGQQLLGRGGLQAPIRALGGIFHDSGI